MRYILTLIGATLMVLGAWAQKPEHIWINYGDRFTAEEDLSLAGVDSVEFFPTRLTRYRTNEATGVVSPMIKTYPKGATYRFGDFRRCIVRPGQYASNDFTSEASRFCFQRSQETVHFICFWEKGLTKTASGDISLNGQTVNVNALLSSAENIWKKYVDDLGFLEEGNSMTDRVKIEMFIVNQTAWRADGSGEEGMTWYMQGTTKKERPVKVGLFHCNPQAAGARGGHTPAHEIAHTFQYLVSADLGMSHGMNYGFGPDGSGGNCWWEDCANWQAYKMYPQMQFSDGEYYEQYMTKHHLNILHEDARYANCYYHDYWCMRHGQNSVGRVWRESNRPEDPMEAYMRIFSLSLDDFEAEMYDCFARMASWDIDGVREQAKHRIGSHQQRLVEPTDDIANAFLGGSGKDWWVVDADFCPQNFGYNINPLKVPEAGTQVRVTFKGIAGAQGYRAVNEADAGWRYGLVAYDSKGTRVYSPMQQDAEGTAEITVPEGCENLWLVVMGAPKKYWRHAWDDDASNDEQWPYAVKFEGTSPLGALRTYGVFPEDYPRRDTTIVINATLAYSGSSYSSVRVQYDTDAISEALGVSTAQLRAIKRNDTTSNPGDVRFAGVNANGTTMNFNTTTSTSSDACYGHWFTLGGNVVGYNSTAAIFAEMYPEKFGCYVGQYPGRLTSGKTYTVRQAVVYTHTDGKMYKAIMEVRLKIE